MTATVTTLRTRPPTGRPGWPRMLLSGEEGARKSWTLAELSADDRIGGMLWLEIGAGESTADEYGAIPGVKYTIIDHDGTWADIYTQLCAAWDVAKAAEAAGEAPIALAVDSMTGLWQMLCVWGDLIARRREVNKATRYNKGAPTAHIYSPDHEAQMDPGVWNLVNRRWGQFMSKVLTWPGPVGMTAREKLVSAFTDAGKPDAKAPKEWSLETQKGLGFQSTVWLRMTRAGKPEIVKMRSVRRGITPDVDAPQSISGSKLSLGAVVFDVIGCEAGVSRAAEHRELNADQTMPGEETPQPEPSGPQRGARQQRPASAPTVSPVERAAVAVSKLLATTDRALVGQIADAAKAEPIVGRVDVSGLLTDEDRQRLDTGPKTTAVRLEFLAGLVDAFVERTGGAVRAPVEAPAGDAAKEVAA